MCSLKEALEVTNNNNIGLLYCNLISIKFYDVKCMSKKKSIMISTSYRKCPQDLKGSEVIKYDLIGLDVYILEKLDNKTKQSIKLYDSGYNKTKYNHYLYTASLNQYWRTKTDLLEKELLDGEILRIRAVSDNFSSIYWKSYKYIDSILYIKQKVKIRYYQRGPLDREFYDVVRLELLDLLADAPKKKSTDMCKVYRLLCDLTNLNVTDIIFDYLHAEEEVYKPKRKLACRRLN